MLVGTIRVFIIIRVPAMSVSSCAITSKHEAVSEEGLGYVLGNSDRIKSRFGSFKIKVLENSDHIRVSKLYTSEAGVETIQTFAVVVYPVVIDPALKQEHQAIIGGESIGIVFRNSGWLINKQHQYFGTLEVLSDSPGNASVFGDIDRQQPAIHVYTLWVTKNKFRFKYAVITEVHHPAYLKLDDLESIYGQDCEDLQDQNPEVLELLRTARYKMQNV